MQFQKIIILIVSFSFVSIFIFGQTGLHVNGKPIDKNRCLDIRHTNENLDSAKVESSDVLEATVEEDCVEIKIQYGGCGGNVEFVTDGKITKSPKPKMYFKLHWVEQSTCKESKQIDIGFDLTPYKKLIQDNKAVISILGTDYELKYKK